MSKAREIWESGHEIPVGAFVPKGTEIVALDVGNDQLTISRTAQDIESWSSYHGKGDLVYLRSVEKIEDVNDTGDVVVFNAGARIGLEIFRDGSPYYYVYLSRDQTRNLMRKLTEVSEAWTQES